MPEKLTIKDIFLRKMKKQSRVYAMRITIERIFCVGNRKAMQMAYIAGSRYGWNQRDKIKSLGYK